MQVVVVFAVGFCFAQTFGVALGEVEYDDRLVLLQQAVGIVQAGPEDTEQPQKVVDQAEPPRRRVTVKAAEEEVNKVLADEVKYAGKQIDKLLHITVSNANEIVTNVVLDAVSRVENMTNPVLINATTRRAQTTIGKALHLIAAHASKNAEKLLQDTVEDGQGAVEDVLSELAFTNDKGEDIINDSADDVLKKPDENSEPPSTVEVRNEEAKRQAAEKAAEDAMAEAIHKQSQQASKNERKARDAREAAKAEKLKEEAEQAQREGDVLIPEKNEDEIAADEAQADEKRKADAAAAMAAADGMAIPAPNTVAPAMTEQQKQNKLNDPVSAAAQAEENNKAESFAPMAAANETEACEIPCSDDVEWKDAEGDGCLTYEDYIVTGEMTREEACAYQSKGASSHCPKTCGTCPSCEKAAAPATNASASAVRGQLVQDTAQAAEPAARVASVSSADEPAQVADASLADEPVQVANVSPAGEPAHSEAPPKVSDDESQPAIEGRDSDDGPSNQAAQQDAQPALEEWPWKNAQTVVEADEACSEECDNDKLWKDADGDDCGRYADYVFSDRVTLREACDYENGTVRTSCPHLCQVCTRCPGSNAHTSQEATLVSSGVGALEGKLRADAIMQDLDTDHDGYVTKDEFHLWLDKQNKELTATQADMVFWAADLNVDGFISKEELQTGPGQRYRPMAVETETPTTKEERAHRKDKRHKARVAKAVERSEQAGEAWAAKVNSIQGFTADVSPPYQATNKTMKADAPADEDSEAPKAAAGFTADVAPPYQATNKTMKADAPADEDSEVAQVKHTSRAAKAFKKMDADGSGGIDLAELKANLQAGGRKVSSSAIKNLFDAADENGDLQIDSEELRQQLLSLAGAIKA